MVDYVIPGNDDALRAIRLFTVEDRGLGREGAQLVSEKAFDERGCGRRAG